MTKKVLLIFVHPAPKRSRYNSRLLQAARGLAHVEVHDLYERYPDFHINVAAEQALIRDADALVFQFPIYWYSAPALLKEWQDEVLTRGFAFGDEGSVLKGKTCLYAVGSGGDKDAYRDAGHHGAPIDAYLTPFLQVARFCGMRSAEPFITQGVGDLTPLELEGAAVRYRDRLTKLLEEC